MNKQKSKYPTISFSEEEKWTGYNNPITEYFKSLLIKIQSACELTDERSTRYVILRLSINIFEALYFRNINSLRKFEETKVLYNFLNYIRSNWRQHDPTLLEEGLSGTPNLIHLMRLEIRRYAASGPNENFYVEEISIFIEKLIKSSVSGEASQALEHFLRENIPNGFDMIRRLLEVFGRTPEHTALIPYFFKWTFDTLYESWIEYKKCLSREQFFLEHPTLTLTAIQQAKFGFLNYEDGDRLTEYLRVQLGDSCDYTWEQFENKVNTFLGDVHKRSFDTAFYNNECSNSVLGLEASWRHDPFHGAHNIRNYKTKPDQYPDAIF